MLPRNRQEQARQLPLFLRGVSEMIAQNQSPDFCSNCPKINPNCPASRINRIVRLVNGNLDMDNDRLGVDEVKLLPFLRDMSNICIKSVVVGENPVEVLNPLNKQNYRT